VSIAHLQGKNLAEWEQRSQAQQQYIGELLLRLPRDLQQEVDEGVAAAVIVNCASWTTCHPLLLKVSENIFPGYSSALAW